MGAAGEMTQPEALRLAQGLNNRQDCEDEAADELRRLLAENEAIKAERDEDRRREYGYSQQVVDALTKERDVLRAQRDALLEALRAAVADWDEEVSRGRWLDAARAAIKAVEEEA